nr:MAG TPA: hypothetical protein [Caudoviricetes sp.]
MQNQQREAGHFLFQRNSGKQNASLCSNSFLQILRI